MGGNRNVHMYAVNTVLLSAQLSMPTPLHTTHLKTRCPLRAGSVCTDVERQELTMVERERREMAALVTSSAKLGKYHLLS